MRSFKSIEDERICNYIKYEGEPCTKIAFNSTNIIFTITSNFSDTAFSLTNSHYTSLEHYNSVLFSTDTTIL